MLVTSTLSDPHMYGTIISVRSVYMYVMFACFTAQACSVHSHMVHKLMQEQSGDFKQNESRNLGSLAKSTVTIVLLFLILLLLQFWQLIQRDIRVSVNWRERLASY